MAVKYLSLLHNWQIVHVAFEYEILVLLVGCNLRHVANVHVDTFYCAFFIGTLFFRTLRDHLICNLDRKSYLVSESAHGVFDL